MFEVGQIGRGCQKSEISNSLLSTCNDYQQILLLRAKVIDWERFLLSRKSNTEQNGTFNYTPWQSRHLCRSAGQQTAGRYISCGRLIRPVLLVSPARVAGQTTLQLLPESGRPRLKNARISLVLILPRLA